MEIYKNVNCRQNYVLLNSKTVVSNAAAQGGVLAVSVTYSLHVIAFNNVTEKNNFPDF